MSADRQYRVTWTRDCFGVRVPSHFHALVQCHRTIEIPDKQWDFAGRRGPYKTKEAAVAACEHHQKMWLLAIEASETERTGRNDRLREVEFRSRIKISKKTNGTGRQRVMCGLPVWVRAKANAILLNHFFPRSRVWVEDEDECQDQSGGDSPASPSIADSSSTTCPESADASNQSPSGPASNATEAGESTTRRRSASTKHDQTASSAESAEGAEKEARKPSRRNTSRKPTSTKKKSKPSSRGKRSSKAPAQS